jgi:serine protease Do
MRSFRSSSDARGRIRGRRRGAALPAWVVLAALLGGPVQAAPAADPAPAAAPTPPAAATPDAPQRTCPRCGYRCDAGWRYCALCGWDLSILAGRDAGDVLSAIGRATVGVIAVHQTPGLEELAPPQFRKYVPQIEHRNHIQPGRHKVFGTAFPIGTGGIYLTTSALLDNAAEVSVRSADNYIYPATILAYDPASGLGALRAEKAMPAGAAPIATAPDDTPPESGWVFCYPVAIEEGVALHLPLSIHAGRVTATGQGGRSIAAFEDLLRTDQAVPHGCEGGLFVDARGRAAGIVVQGQQAGLTWLQALGPMRRAIEALGRGEDPAWPYYGFGLAAADDLRRRRFGLPAEESRPVVSFLVADAPAQSAGLEAGDVIATVDGEAVATLPAATRALTRASPGGPTTRLGVLRHGVAQEVAIAPARRPTNIMLDPVDELAEGLEAVLEEVTTGLTSQQGLRIAALATGGRGAEDGYAVGDVIQVIGSKRIRTFASFSRAVRDDNRHLFPEAGAPEEPHRRVSTYFLRLDLRTAKGGAETRVYANYFPDRLTAPVY